MRAVNLIPTDYRRGPLAGQGGVIASYAILAALAALLLAVVMIVLTNNQISDRKAEIAKLEQEKRDAETRAAALQSFANFQSLAGTRASTVTSLAQSRFDWERVMRELAVVIPSDVWLTQLGGSVLPSVSIEGAPNFGSRSSVAGPALQIVGCAPNSDSVANFVAALEDIDGVTRVGVQSSVKSDDAESGGGDATAANDDCRTRDFISKFELVVAFDAAPVPPDAAAAAGLPVPATPTPPPAGEVGDAQQQQASATQSVQETSSEAKDKVDNYVPGN